MAAIVALTEAVADIIHDGDAVAMEGFTHLIPHAAGHEIIRQRRRDLTLYRMTPDIIYDQLIGVGAVSKLVFSWGGNPGVGSLHRFRDAVEHGWPNRLELVEHSHGAMVTAYVAGASNLPFGIMNGVRRTDVPAIPAAAWWIDNPWGTGQLLAVKANRPDVTVIHAQRSDRQGNVQLWGIVGVQKEAVMAARRTIVTVEEVVDSLPPMAGAIVLSHRLITAVCEVPGGAHPSYTHGYSKRDNLFYKRWDAISRDRNRFTDWIDRHVRATTDMQSYFASLRSETSE